MRHSKKQNWRMGLWAIIIISMLVLAVLVDTGHCEEYILQDESGFVSYVVATCACTYFANSATGFLDADFNDYFYRAKPRGVFDGIDRETHMIGGFALYNYFRDRDKSKGKSLFYTTLASLVWEFKDSWRIMNYKHEWYRKTSLGHILIHFAGDGFDLQDHYCVMIGSGVAIGIEFINEKWFSNKRLIPRLFAETSKIGLEIKL